MSLSNNPTAIREALKERFDLEELRTLVMDLGLDYDDLRGEGKAAKARELVLFMQRRGWLDELVAAIQAARGEGAPTGIDDPLQSSSEQIIINTGGGAYVGGNVEIGGDFVGRDRVHIAGDGSVVGDHSSATVIEQTTESATTEQFLKLLAELRGALAQSGLDADTVQVIEADVKVVEDQTRKAQPSSAIVVSKLKGVTEALTQAGQAVATAAPLVSLAQKALTWAQQLF